MADKSSSDQTPAAAGRSRGLFESSFGQESVVASQSVSDIWNVSAPGGFGGSKSGSMWFPDQGLFAGDQPSPAQVRTKQGSTVLKRRGGLERLKKSMNELDEVVSPSSTPHHHLSMGVASYTTGPAPGSLLRESLLNQSRDPPLDLDTPPRHMPMGKLLLATPNYTNTSLSMMDETGNTRQLLLEGTPTGNQTYYDNRTEDFSFWDTSKFMAVAPESKLLEDPVEKVGRNLIRCFHDCFSSHHIPGDVLELLGSLQKACEDQVEELKETAEMSKGGIHTQLMLELEHERSTWELIHALYTDRINADLLDQDQWDGGETMVTDLNSAQQSEKEIAKDLFEKDDSVRQAQEVVDWLEKNARSNLKYFPEKIHFFADDVMWENTFHRLQFARDTDRDHIITEMDPDAPTRQGRSLADLDAKDEQSLVKHLFAYLRAGQFVEAQELCARCGQPWRAASLEGWRLCHDPNYGKSYDDDAIEPTEGNQTRDLWKLACWEMARDPSFSIHEKALYATLAGDIKNILPVCVNWCDYVWAHFKVMVDVKTEQKLRTCSPATGQSRESLPPEYWNSILLPELIFQEIEASQSEVIREESKNQFHLTHKFIILGELEILIRTIHSWLEDSPSINQLRFMAHLVLFVKGLGMAVEDDKCNEILATYVQELVNKAYYPLVALYTSQLPSAAQVSSYTDLLRRINDPEEQRRCLDLGKRAGLDIAVITKSVVEQIKNVGLDVTLEGPALELGSEVELTKVDLSKIEVIKWLVFEEAQRSEAIIQGNALMRQFLACRKLKAARAVFSKIPPDSVQVVSRNWQKEVGDQSLSLQLTNAIKEYHCIQTYLDAHDSFNAWFQHFHQDKPEPPPEPSHADLRGNAQYEQKLKQYKDTVGNWNSSLEYLSENAEVKLHNLLEGGWMVDIQRTEQSEAVQDEFRARQMRLLRETCIPQVSFLLLTIFNSTQQFSKSLRLADVVASEEHQLYQLFRQHELEKLLSMIHEAACSVVDDGKSELGFAI